jgi:LysM repeat protein
MSLQTLHDLFVAEAASGPILIDAAIISQAGLTPSKGLDALLTRAFMLPGTGLSVLQPANISAVADNKFTFEGTIDTPVARNKPIVATFTTDGDLAIFYIVVTLGSSWKFADSFVYMNGRAYNALPTTGSSFAFATRKTDSFPVNGVATKLLPGLNLAADITLTSVLSGLPVLFSGLKPELKRRFTGSVDPGQIGTKTSSGKKVLVPALDLDADLGVGSYQYAFLTMDRPYFRFATEDYGAEFGPVPVLAADADLQIEGGSPVTFEAKLPLTGSTYSFAVYGTDGGLILTPRQLFDLMAGRTWYDVVPPTLLQFLDSFGAKMFSANIVADTLTVTSVSAQVGSDPNKSWTFLDGLFTIKSFDVWWTILSPLKQPVVTATFASTFQFFPQIFKGDFAVSITSELVVTGSFAGTVDFADIVSGMTNGAVRIPPQFALTFSDFGVSVDTRGNSYSLWGGTTLTLNLFGGVKFGLEDVSFSLSTFPAGSGGNPGNVALAKAVKDEAGTSYVAAIEGTLILGPVYLDATLGYEDGLWTASLATQADDELSLQTLIDEVFASVSLPTDWFDLDVAASNLLLEAEVQTGATGTNLYRASADFTWHFAIAGNSFDTLATVRLQYDSSQKLQPYTGSVDAVIQFELFGIGTIFGIRYAIENDPQGQAKNSIALSWNDLVASYEKTGQSSKIVFTAGPGWSLGRLVTSLVQLISPSSLRNLPPPWNLLNEVSLAGLRVEFDLTSEKVTVSWPIKLNLFFLTLERIDIVKTPGQQVDVQLVGSYIGGEPIPAWNAVSQDPPTVPGGGTEAFDLRLLAIGQRVTIPGLAAIQTVGDAVDALRKFAQPAPSSKKIPVGTDPSSGNPIYSADNHLLIGAHFLALSGAIEVKLIFNDPVLYGLRINLVGEKVGPFAGLEFEILYKKVTDTIGVYKLMLKLPDSMRYLQFGSVTVILPIVGVEIYTNGDFKIDFGFPYKLDFSRSFTLQIFPFTGSGGFYFAKLSGATANSVPKTSKGTFNPVIEFGFGLQVGLGKSLSLGILKAEISVTIFGIVEGILAAWQPYPSSQLALPGAGAGSRDLVADAAQDQLYYYWIRGTIGILGKISGVVDFAIIKAEVSLEVRAYVQVTLESYAEIRIYLEAGVSVSIKIRINLGLFKITISLSFSATIRQSFVIGTDRRSEAPWYDPAQVGIERRPQRLRFSRSQAMLMTTSEPDFAPLATPASGTTDLTAYFMAQPTVYSDTPEIAGSELAAFVATTYMESPSAGGGAAGSFELLTRDLFLWVGSAFRGGAAKPTPDEEAASVYSRPQLMTALDYLSDNSTRQSFTYAQLSAFIAGLFKIRLSLPPETTDEQGPPVTVFPMIPGLHLAASYKDKVLADVDFTSYGTVDGAYLERLSASIDLLVAKYLDELEAQESAGAAPLMLSAQAIESQSIAQFIFVDYFVMMARYMVQEAIDVLDAYAYPILTGGAPARTLSSIVAYINGLAPSGGSDLIVNDVTYVDIGEANRDHPLAGGKSFSISGVLIQLRQPLSLGAIAAAYKVSPGDIALANAARRELFAAGKVVQLNGKAVPIGPNTTFETLAADSSLDVAAVGDAIKDDASAIAPLALFAMPPVPYTTSTTAGAPDTLGTIAAAYAVSTASLAFDARDVDSLFATDADPFLLLPELACLPARSLLDDMAAHDSARHLSGMAARYLLHGLRLWTDGVTYPGAAPFAAEEAEAGLYRLTGQRVTAPDLAGYQDSDPLSLALSNPKSLSWVVLIDPATRAAGARLPFAVPRDGAVWLEQLLAVAKSPGLQAPIMSLAEASSPQRREKTFSFKSRIDLQAAGPIDLPNGAPSADPGVPTLAIWTFSDALLATIQNHETQAIAAGVAPEAVLPYLFAPKASIQTIPNRPPRIEDVAHYGFAGLVDVNIKRIAAVEGVAASIPTYDLIGTDQAGEKLLESLLAGITPEDSSAIQDIYVLYRPNQAGDRSSGLQYDGEDHYKAFLIRTNLSTETNPPSAQEGPLSADADAAPAPATGILNDRYDFISSVWQASVTRSGGFSLSYQLTGGAGFPDAIFDEDGNATIALLILYAEAGGAVMPRTNALVTGDSIDSSSTSVYAQSVARPIPAQSTDGKSLAQIADMYGVYVTDLAIAGADKPLAGGSLRITDIVTQVQPGETLAQVASRFGVAEAEIKRLNPIPGIDWNALPAGTGLAIPDIDRQVPAGGGATLTGLARDLSSQVAAIGFANRGLAGLFVAGTTLAFDQVILEKQAQVPPGNIGLTLVRTNPGEDSGDPPVFLEQDYSLLGYQIVANANFASPPGSLAMPAGPAEDHSEEEMKALRRPSLDAAAAAADWTFRLVVPASRLALVHAAPAAGTPDPMMNPYAGVGGFVQLTLDWRDFFGDLIPDPFTQPPTPAYPLNNLPLRVLYVDPVIGLGAWPSTEYDYLYRKGADGPELAFSLRFNTSRYEPTTLVNQPLATPLEDGDVEAWKKNAMADRQVFANIHYQLNQSGPAPDHLPSVRILVSDSVKAGEETAIEGAGLESLKAYVDAAWAYVDAVVNGAQRAPVGPVAISLPTAAAFTGDIAHIAVSVAMRRAPSQIAAEFRDYLEAAAAITALPPQLVKQEGGGYTLDAFTAAFEQAFDGGASRLKLATGEDGSQKGIPAPSDVSLWAVRLARSGAPAGAGFSYALAGDPAFYAPAPLSTELISRDTPVGCYSYTREAGLSAEPNSYRTFSGIDLDQWGRILLDAIDLVLQPRYASPTFLVDWRGGTGYQAKILKAKYDLADAISSGVTNILTNPPLTPGSDPAAFADAREKLRQQLLIELGNAYDVDAIVQHDVTVGSSESGPRAPRLYGQPMAALAQARQLAGPGGGAGNDSFSTSSFKFDLAAGTSYLTYPFRAKSAAEQRDFRLDVAYNPTQVEHQIAAVRGIDGYVASSWLSFITPLPPIAAGEEGSLAVDVPLVLRAYPTPPSMQAQQAIRLNVDASGATARLREAKGWNYDFTYEKQRAAQDRVHAMVRLNVAKGADSRLMAETVDLFTALARFTSVYPQIQQTFDQVLAGISLDTEPASQAFGEAALALSAFATLIENIGAIWGAWVAAQSPATATIDSRDSQVQFDFVIDETPTQYQGSEALEVTISYAGPLPPDVSSPELVFDDYRAVPQPGASSAEDGATVNRYIYLDAGDKALGYAEAQAISSRRARFAALDAIQYQNAWSSLQISRNALLVEGNPTRKPFVYTTQWVSFRDKLAPRLVTDQPIPVEQVPTDQPQKRTLLAHLEALFEAFFYRSAVDRQLVKIEVTYSYRPGDFAALPLVTLPVLLVPASDYVTSVPVAAELRRDATGSELDLPVLAQAIKDWFKGNQVARGGGLFGFSLTAFSALELNTQPLVQIPALTLDLAYIADL